VVLVASSIKIAPMPMNVTLVLIEYAAKKIIIENRIIEIAGVGNTKTGNIKIKTMHEISSKIDDPDLSFKKISAFLNML
jgi:hypothetical protein